MSALSVPVVCLCLCVWPGTFMSVVCLSSIPVCSHHQVQGSSHRLSFSSSSLLSLSLASRCVLCVYVSSRRVLCFCVCVCVCVGGSSAYLACHCRLVLFLVSSVVTSFLGLLCTPPLDLWRPSLATLLPHSLSLSYVVIVVVSNSLDGCRLRRVVVEVFLIAGALPQWYRHVERP